MWNANDAVYELRISPASCGDLYRAGYCGVVNSCALGAVRIVNHYVIEGAGIEFRLRTRFFAAVQTSTGAHPTTYNMGTGFLSLG